MGGNRSKFQILRQYRHYASSVSKAIWPQSIRRCIATSKAAQGRRLMMMKGFWKARTQRNRVTTRLCLYYTCRTAPMPQRIIIILLAAASIPALYIFYQWPTLALFIGIWLMMSLLVCRLLFRRKYHTSTTITPRAIGGSSAPEKSQQQSLFNFPETPVPSTPLIRVLETIDLSSTDVEHFINTPLAILPIIETPVKEPIYDDLPIDEEDL